MNENDQQEEDRNSAPTTSAPPVTDDLRAEARANPGGWVYAVDPGFEGSAEVPPEGIVGAWKVDENGELEDAFTPNPRYRPTPQARGWFPPKTPLERVLQLVLSGYLPDDRLGRAFAEAEVFIFSRAEGGIFVAPAEDGGKLVYAFTDVDKATASGYDEHASMTGVELASALPEGVRIALNAGHSVSAIIHPADVKTE